MHQGFAVADFLNDPVLLFAVGLLLLVGLGLALLFRKKLTPVQKGVVIVFLVLAVLCLLLVGWLTAMWGQPPAAPPVPAPALG